MITTQGVVDWLLAQGVVSSLVPALPVQPGPYEDDDIVDRQLIVTKQPSGGYTMDGAFRLQNFQLELIGDQNLDATAETIANTINKLLEDTVCTTIDGHYVLRITSEGEFAPTGPPEGEERLRLQGTYVFEASAERV